MTYIPTGEGWLPGRGAGPVQPASWAGRWGPAITAELACRALDMAWHQRSPAARLIFHSDRGSQYASHRYTDLLARHGIKASMSRKGNCWDNVCSEILLLAAGHGTTTHLLGNGLLALMRHHEQWQLLATDATIALSAVNELLRFDAPVQATGREALEDMQLGGKTIAKGEHVRVFLGSANRDEEHFQDPDTLDLRRAGARILSFGHGIHTCLGAALARMEAQIAFAELARRFPGTGLEIEAPQRLPSINFRGLKSLPVALR